MKKILKLSILIHVLSLSTYFYNVYVYKRSAAVPVKQLSKIYGYADERNLGSASNSRETTNTSTDKAIPRVYTPEEMIKRLSLDIDKMMLPESETKWPVVVMINNGRTGNCLNSYAVSLVLKEEFGDNMTIAVRRDLYDKVANVMEIQGLTLPIVETSFIDKVKAMQMDVLPPQKFLVKINLVAHLQPSIKNEIKQFQDTQQKKVLILEGFPNRMYMIADFQDQIRKIFHIKDNLQDKAQTFLNKVSSGRGIDLVLVGFHIRRQDYIDHSKNYNGVSVPGPDYYVEALTYYRKRFDNILFVVASDDLEHAKTHLKKHKDVVFTEFTQLEEDMALLAACNHSIMTVGSFAFWSSFLAGGDVTYSLLYNFNTPPFVHPEMLGPHGFEKFHGIPVNPK